MKKPKKLTKLPARKLIRALFPKQVVAILNQALNQTKFRASRDK